MKTAIKVEKIAKCYTLGAIKDSTFRDSISSIFKPKKANNSTLFWALKEISFDVNKGEIIGIIGKNGAGKSTLLKILSQITKPSSGKIELKVRVASLLEVVTGFHPELTGRENIFLNGTILGMKRTEIISKFDEIVAFSGVEKFLDTPVKHYSSGMYVRLAFAVAAHLEPEILIIDEVLAVGDSDFQKKCLGKMSEVANSGRTVLFVSHNMQAVSALTKKCILLNDGMIEYFGDTNAAIQKYLCNSNEIYFNSTKQDSPYIKKVEIHSSESTNIHQVNKPFAITFDIETNQLLKGAAVSFQIVDNEGTPITHVLNIDSEVPFCNEIGVFKLKCAFPKLRLYPGKYSLTVYFAELSTKNHFETLENICPFEVVVLNEIRDYYWIPNHARYIDDYQWSQIS